MTHVSPTRDDASEQGWSKFRFAAEVFATKECNRLEDILDPNDGAQELEGYRAINAERPEMEFLPEHQGCGFTGEFIDHGLLVPAWLDGDGSEPSVHNALVREFQAGARWRGRAIKP